MPSVETRRGLPVKRPKGKPFSYTVSDNETFVRRTIRVLVDGASGPMSDDLLSISIEHDGEAIVWDNLYRSGPFRCERFDFMENYYRAMLWAVDYARRWNKTHGLTPASPVG